MDVDVDVAEIDLSGAVFCANWKAFKNVGIS